MRKLLVSAGAIGVLAMAGVIQSGTPAQACASTAGGQTGLDASPAFLFEEGPDYYSPDGSTYTTPLFGEVGNISIGQVEDGSPAYDNDTLQYQGETEGAQIVFDPCPGAEAD